MNSWLVFRYLPTPELLADLVIFRRADRKERRNVLGGRQLLARLEFRPIEHFLSRVFFTNLCGKRPKSPLFTPVFRLSSRPGEGPFCSLFWACFNRTIIYSVFVPHFPVFQSATICRLFCPSAPGYPLRAPFHASRLVCASDFNPSPNRRMISNAPPTGISRKPTCRPATMPGTCSASTPNPKARANTCSRSKHASA